MPRSLPKSSLACALALSAVAATAPAAQAATATTTFAVTLTVLSECVVAAGPMAFGTLGVVGTGGTAQNAILVTCTAQIPFSIGLNAGTGTGATTATRFLTGPNASQVAYTLYQNSTFTTLWGNTTTTDLDSTATGLPQSFPVYGRILPGQGAALPGAYTDTITVTVTY